MKVDSSVNASLLPIRPAIRSSDPFMAFAHREHLGAWSNTAAAALLLIMLTATVATAQETPSPPAAERPNILWLTSEDNGPHLGAYGDPFATTPNLDTLASRGMIYLNAWSNAPVCAPARTAIITGIYPPSTGSEHMRSNLRLPPDIVMFPRLLRQAGYYCTNNNKEDYNLAKTGRVWDESSRRAHWKNRAAGQPFFAVFNFTVTHESQIRKRPHKVVHDPDKVPIPAYHPDTPEVRQDWAQYYDKMSEMDAMAGAKLQELADAGLADDTIVFYYGDHGPGMPRCKRWPYNSGLRVPMIVYIPDKFRHLAPPEYDAGDQTSRLVSFVDLAPTVLSLAGLQPPEWIQGHAFLGPFAELPRTHVFGFRGRMDERYDLVRSVRNERYVYVRHFMPHRIYGQFLEYMFQTPTTQVWKRLHEQGHLNEIQARFWNTKPTEELYDLENDPDETVNLANSPEHQQVKHELQSALRRWQTEIRDLGLLPEAEMHRRMADGTAYDLARDAAAYPLERIAEMAYHASDLSDHNTSRSVARFQDSDSAVRYWAATGLLIRAAHGRPLPSEPLVSCLDDTSPSVRIVAAEALVRFGSLDERARALETLVGLADQTQHGLYVAVEALNAIAHSRSHAESIMPQLQALPVESDQVPARLNTYVPRLLDQIVNEHRK